MIDPSALAPLVTMTFVQALLSKLLAANAAVSTKMAFTSLLILFFYYK
jgi:hypothetical protein